ncbi:hypothetical protein FPV67DRAFT_223242 [Lyophyllum atratum]|nr:hypothetical protein FPV67DRAFT_223242 [Lyophyllum atratum]
MSDNLCAKCYKADAPKICSRCRAIVYCSVECQTEDWKTHKPDCIPHSVSGITIHCNRDRPNHGTFQRVDIHVDHPIHPFGELAPVSRAINLPLVVYRHVRRPWTERPTQDGGLDNQIATYLMIDRTSGFASLEYQKQVGTITVMRKDGKALTHESIETIWTFHRGLLDLFGEDPALAREEINRAAFDDYCQRYKDDKLLNGDESFRDMELPL